MSLMAVIKTGGKQYLVKQGDNLQIEKLEAKVGSKVLFKDVFLCFDSEKKSEVEIGKPNLKIKVEAEIISQEKGKKIKIIKYKPKVRYHRENGHRQPYTQIKILKIGKE
jgi:large subunit ribosomal protein L21